VLQARLTVTVDRLSKQVVLFAKQCYSNQTFLNIYRHWGKRKRILPAADSVTLINRGNGEFWVNVVVLKLFLISCSKRGATGVDNLVLAYSLIKKALCGLVHWSIHRKPDPLLLHHNFHPQVKWRSPQLQSNTAFNPKGTSIALGKLPKTGSTNARVVICAPADVYK